MDGRDAPPLLQSMGSLFGRQPWDSRSANIRVRARAASTVAHRAPGRRSIFLFGLQSLFAFDSDTARLAGQAGFISFIAFDSLDHRGGRLSVVDPAASALGRLGVPCLVPPYSNTASCPFWRHCCPWLLSQSLVTGARRSRRLRWPPKRMRLKALCNVLGWPWDTPAAASLPSRLIRRPGGSALHIALLRRALIDRHRTAFAGVALGVVSDRRYTDTRQSAIPLLSIPKMSMSSSP